ncbi:MAG: pyridoxamine 5'-phosphate oxidase family protein [bacterium]|nr:pyridoxamine 5'-phosphate oxidase family protein [bacterium]
MDKRLSKEKFLSKFKKLQVIYFSTVDGKAPRLRPVTLLKINGELWIATGSRDNKIKQLSKNKNIEFCLPLSNVKNSGYIRGRGTGEIVKDGKVKVNIAKKISFFTNFWKEYTDPGYALIKLNINEVEILTPGKMLAETFKI